MKRQISFLFSLLMIAAIATAPVCFAAAPAEGFDPADGKYIKAESGHYWQGRYSDGRIFSEYLAKELTGDFNNLENYAVGGSFSGILTGNAADGTDRSNWSSWLKGWGGIEQTDRFIKDRNGKADPKGLYVISTGGNDSYTVDSLGLDGATQKSAANIVTMIDNLAKAGATDFIVMLQSTTPGKTETDFTKAHRAATRKTVSEYIAGHKDCNIVMVDIDDLYRDMEKQGKEAYGYKTWGFYMISDWVPAYGYVYAADDNSRLLPANKAEDIYDYRYYYSKDSAYYTPEAADYAVDEFLYYDEYHPTSRTQMHKASYILNSDLTTDKGVFKKVYNATASAFALSPMADKTYSMVYTFGDSLIDSGRALEVTGELVKNREVKTTGIRDMKDTDQNAWYATYVNYALQTGIMKGIDSDSFAPDDGITLGQFMTILGRTAGVKDDPENYCASHIAWAIEKGLVSGTAGSDFSPNAKMSHRDMLKIIGSYAKLRGYQLNEADILTVYGSSPNNDKMVTRAEAASVLAKLINY